MRTFQKNYRRLLAREFFTVKVDGKDLKAISVGRLVAGRAGVELLDCLERAFPPRKLSPDRIEGRC
jgi:hypothetical protein